MSNLPTLKISPSTLETFRSFKEAKFEGTEYQVTTDKMIRYIKGEKQFTQALTQGKALHELLEQGTEQYAQPDGSAIVTTEDKQRVHFVPYIKRVVDRYRQLHPDMMHEIPFHLTMNVLGYEVRSNMRLDGLEYAPSVIYDFKTSSKAYGQVTEYQYYDSVQWRMYLLACDDVDVFQYDIFHFQQNVPDAVRPMEYYNFQFFRETDMKQIVGDWMMGYIKFCEQHDLIDFIKIKK